MQKYISIKLVNKARASHSWDTLSYYVWLRYHYQKPIFYSYTTRSIGAILNVSPTTASKHVKRMIHLGWAKESNGHLILLSNKKEVRESEKLYKKKNLVKVVMYRTKAEQIIYLKNIEINNSIIQQQKKINKKTEVVKKAGLPHAKISKAQLKKIAEAGGIEVLERSINSRTTLSNRKIGVMFGVCKRTASRYQVYMNKMGILSSISFYEEVAADFFNLKPNQFYSFNHKILERKSNTLKLTITIPTALVIIDK